ncbi:GMC family oxidoreductase [Sediminicola sp. 1XM1-17]|uniref:GMC family oxidoreductase n=1 Tax=Sediminicola sp. 1XM1-17 TaxID=3127702 RepID=UPI0030768F20
MHIDARELEANTLIEGDICIIGAGTAGISMALDLMHSSHKIILLEGGGFKYEDEIQDAYAGNTSGQRYYPLKSSRLHYFGGTTGHWAGMCSPFDPIDFKIRDWVPHSGWPITKKDLDPFYAKAHETLQLGPYKYELEYWRQVLPNLNPFPLDNKVVWNKMWQYSTARFGKIYRDTIMDAPNIHLYTYASATEIKSNPLGNHIGEATIKNLTGKSHTVKAKYFIMACGAIQNARLLLASRSISPNGLGNDNDLVGRYFMEHLEVPSAELWLSQPFPTDLYAWTYGETKASAELAITEYAQRENQILNGTASLVPLTVGRHQKSRLDSWTDYDPKKAMKNMMRDWQLAEEKAKKDNIGAISKAYQLNTRIEQAPNPNSRITLGSEKDALGVPRANLHWELTPLDKKSIRKIYELIGQHVGISNLGRVRLMEFLQDPTDDSFPDTVNGGWHHMGTTRMANDPKKGVVDSNCKVHGITNLYIAGSGCYPTSGAPNPTLTLVALSLRLSGHIADIMKKS